MPGPDCNPADDDPHWDCGLMVFSLKEQIKVLKQGLSDEQQLYSSRVEKLNQEILAQSAEITCLKRRVAEQQETIESIRKTGNTKTANFGGAG